MLLSRCRSPGITAADWRERCGAAGAAALEAEAAVDRSVDADTRARLAGIAGWRGFNNPWMPEDDGDLEFSYINLLKNPERYTGYKAWPPARARALAHSSKCAGSASAGRLWNSRSTRLPSPAAAPELAEHELAVQQLCTVTDHAFCLCCAALLRFALQITGNCVQARAFHA